jgi:hypothetical protein
MRLDQLVTRAARLAAGRFDACHTAPDTWERLCDRHASGGRLQVYSGHSDGTIYGAPEVNHAFRAWHDATHLKLGADFSFGGEIRTALEQLRFARALGADAVQLAMLRADTIGQVQYFARTGRFVNDQVRFVARYLEG